MTTTQVLFIPCVTLYHFTDFDFSAGNFDLLAGGPQRVGDTRGVWAFFSPAGYFSRSLYRLDLSVPVSVPCVVYGLGGRDEVWRGVLGDAPQGYLLECCLLVPHLPASVVRAVWRLKVGSFRTVGRPMRL